MRWRKGHSGNPGGRPKGHGELRELARRHTQVALETLVEVAKNGQSESARVSAAVALLDRGHGKPTQLITGDDEEDIIKLTRAELNRQAQQKIIDTFGPLIAASAEEEARRSDEEALFRPLLEREPKTLEEPGG